MAQFDRAAKDPSIKVAILTGTDPYYCAGVDLSGSFKPMPVKAMQEMIRRDNQRLFDTFLKFPKPLIVAVNGPAIGASVTSATLADAIVASEKATFSTPFGRLHVTPEGCSSIHFDKIMGKVNAERMLKEEGWKPTAQEAKEAGFVHAVVAHGEVVNEAQRLAETWIKEGKLTRKMHTTPMMLDTYLACNALESIELSHAFLSPGFLQAQINLAKEKKKTQVQVIFSIALFTRPLWSRYMVNKEAQKRKYLPRVVISDVTPHK